MNKFIKKKLVQYKGKSKQTQNKTTVYIKEF